MEGLIKAAVIVLHKQVHYTTCHVYMYIVRYTKMIIHVLYNMYNIYMCTSNVLDCNKNTCTFMYEMDTGKFGHALVHVHVMYCISVNGIHTHVHVHYIHKHEDNTICCVIYLHDFSIKVQLCMYMYMYMNMNILGKLKAVHACTVYMCT